jgi:DNA topoisomerase-1
MDKITYAEAMELFKLPRSLGETPEGETVQASVGRFGPYIKYGAKYVSLKDDDPYTVELPRALEVIRAKQEADANRLIQDFGVDEIQVLNGRYGPYITDKARNAKIPKDRDPKTLTLDECRELLAAAPPRGSRFKGKKKAAGKTKPEPATADTAASAKDNPPAAKKSARAKPAAKKRVTAKKKSPAKKKKAKSASAD